MLIRLIHFVLGYLVIQMPAEGAVTLVHLASQQGMTLWKLRQVEEGKLEAHVSVRAFSLLRPWVRLAGCRPRIVRRVGFPFLFRRIRRRRLLVVGAVLTAAVVYVITSYVWVVEVHGVYRVAPSQVEEAAATLGLRPGVQKKDISGDKIARGLPLLLPDLAWAEVKLDGSRALILVVEKEAVPPEQLPDSMPADIVAAKAGIIQRMVVQMGFPHVAEGDRVYPGQLLVSGEVLIPQVVDPESGDRPAVPPPVRARAQITAQVEYTMEAEQTRHVVKNERTGRVYVVRQLRFFDRSLALAFGRQREEPPFDTYELERVRLLPPRWRNTRIPIELVTLRYYEVNRHKEELSVREAALQAESLARKRISERIPLDSRLVSEKVEQVIADAERVRVRVTLTTEEEIGDVRKRDDVNGNGSQEPDRRTDE